MGLFSKKPKSSIDPAEFLSLRSELADLRDRLEASEHAKAITEARLAALDATTTAMSAERPSGEDLRTRVSELEEQLNVVAEHAAAAQTNADNAEAKATAAVAANAAGTPADAPATEPHPELLARVEALAEQINAISNAPDPSIAARLDELASKVEAGPGPDPGLLARLDQLSSRLDSTPDGGRLSEMEARLGELAARAAEPVAGTASGPDPDTAARLDQLAERVASVDSITSQLAQLNARVSAQAEFGTQLSSLRDRISQLHDETEERRAAAVAATDDADLRDRVNAIADRIAATEGLATQIAQLAETGGSHRHHHPAGHRTCCRRRTAVERCQHRTGKPGRRARPRHRRPCRAQQRVGEEQRRRRRDRRPEVGAGEAGRRAGTLRDRLPRRPRRVGRAGTPRPPPVRGPPAAGLSRRAGRVLAPPGRERLSSSRRTWRSLARPAPHRRPRRAAPPG
jgi:hypothetical protein